MEPFWIRLHRHEGVGNVTPYPPILFLFVANELSALLRHGVQDHAFQIVKICSRAPAIWHILFADDTVLLFKASVVQAQYVKGVLQSYAVATGQLINPQKCSIQFGDNCPLVIQTAVRQVLQVHNVEFEGKYLGLPTPDGRMHKGKFQMLQASLTKRIMAWGDTLSKAGKEN